MLEQRTFSSIKSAGRTVLIHISPIRTVFTTFTSRHEAPGCKEEKADQNSNNCIEIYFGGTKEAVDPLKELASETFIELGVVTLSETGEPSCDFSPKEAGSVPVNHSEKLKSQQYLIEEYKINSETKLKI